MTGGTAGWRECSNAWLAKSARSFRSTTVMAKMVARPSGGESDAATPAITMTANTSAMREYGQNTNTTILVRW